MDNFVNAVNWLAHAVIQLVILLLIINAVLSWLIAFDLVGRGNRFVGSIYEGASRLTQPLLAPIRSVIPPVGGIDLSFIVLFLLLSFLLRLLPPVY